MAKRGTKPKPTALKVVQGTFRPDRASKTEPKPRPIAPTCPSFLTSPARTEWKRIIKEMETLGLVTGLDRSTFATYCQAWADYKGAQEMMHAPGHDIVLMGRQGLKKHPAWQVQRDAAMLMLKCGAELGLTPSSRGQIKLPTPKDDDSIEAFLNGETNKIS